MKSVSTVLGATVLSITAVLAAPLAAHAADFGAGNGFSGNASPALPSCTEDGVFEEFTLSNLDDPYSDATGGTVELGSNSLRVVKSGDPYYPNALILVDPDGKELRYDSNTDSWIGKLDGRGFGGMERWSNAGRLYGLYSGGEYYVSADSDEGTFLSTSSHSNGDDVSYTSASNLNDCVEQAAIVKGTIPGAKASSNGSGNKSGSNGSSSGSTGSTTTATGSTGTGGLASTGVDASTVAALGGLGVLAIVGGGLLVFRRRAHQN